MEERSRRKSKGLSVAVISVIDISASLSPAVITTYSHHCQPLKGEFNFMQIVAQIML